MSNIQSMLSTISDILEECELEGILLEPATLQGKDWIYFKMKGYRSIRINDRGFWEQIGGGRFGKADFRDAVSEVLHIFRCNLARARFINDAQIGKCANRELRNLDNAGWHESCPSENGWHFYHPEFPNVRITWCHVAEGSSFTVEAW